MRYLFHMYSHGKPRSLRCVCYSIFKKCLQNTFLQSIFAKIMIVLGPFWLYGEFDDKYPKKLASVTRKDTSGHIDLTIYNSLWFYDSGFGFKNSPKYPLLAKRWEFYDTALFCWNYEFLKMVSPDNVSQHIWKPKRRDYTLKQFEMKMSCELNPDGLLPPLYLDSPGA